MSWGAGSFGSFSWGGETPSGAGASVDAPTGTVTVDGQSPSVSSSVSLVASLGLVLIVGLGPSISVGQTIAAPTGAVTVDGLTPDVGIAYIVDAPTGIVTIDGLDPTAVAGVGVLPPTGTVYITGATPSVSVGVSLSPPTGTVVITGKRPMAGIAGVYPQTEPGIRQTVYLGGYTLALSPATISETPFRAETAERMANAFTVIDRPYLFTGAPDVIRKFTWALEWPSVNSADYQTFAEIESINGIFDFCLWRPIIETFSGDETSTGFYLMRRLADVALTTPPGTWDPVTKINGIASENPAFIAPTEDGRTKMRFTPAPTTGTSNVRVFYTPVYYVRVVRQTRDMTTPFAEKRVLLLEEV